MIEVEDCVQIKKNCLKKYLEISRENILAKIGRNDVLEYNKYSKSKEVIKIELNKKYHGKTIHRQFRKSLHEVMGRKTWGWLKKGYFKQEAE